MIYISDEYKVVTTKVRNVFVPRWWQLRRRFRLWRGERRRYKERADLSPEGQELLDEMQKEIERKLIFGGKENDDPSGLTNR